MEKQIKLIWEQVWELVARCSAVEVDQVEVTYAQLWDADEDEPEHIQLEHFGKILQFVESDNPVGTVLADPFLGELIGPVRLIATDGQAYDLLLLRPMDLAVSLLELGA